MVNETLLATIGEIKSVLSPIEDEETYRITEELLIILLDIKREIEEEFDPEIKKCHEAHKDALARKKVYEKPREEAETICKKYLSEYATKNREEEIGSLTNTKEVYEWKILDMLAFCKGIIDGKIPVDAICANETFINQNVKLFKEKLDWPGLVIEKKKGVLRKRGSDGKLN